MRVQIPAYTDRWMMGDRFGEVVKVTRRKGKAKNGAEDPSYEVAHVRLDKSGKTMRFMLADCTVVETTSLGVPENTRKGVEDALRKRFPGLGDRLIVI